jgi:hypothetical protein
MTKYEIDTLFLGGINQNIDRMDQAPPEDTLFTTDLMFFESVIIE